MYEKELMVKRNLRDWNSQMKSKSVDLEINEANYGDNNRNINLINSNNENRK